VPEGLAETLWSIATGELRGPEAEAVLDRVLQDPDTAELWRATFALAEEAGLENAAGSDEADVDESQLLADSPAANSRPAANTGPMGSRWLGLAGAAAAALMLVWLWPSPKPPTPGDPSVDDPTVAPVIRAVDHPAIGSALESESLPREACLLQWKGGPVGARFDVWVETRAGVRLATGLDLEGTQFQVPVDALRDVAEGEAIVWRITALAEDGRRVDSPSFQVRVQ